MLRQLLQIPYIKDLVKRPRREESLREACCYRDKTPTKALFTQMKKCIGAEGFPIIEARLRHEALKIEVGEKVLWTLEEDRAYLKKVSV
jgi:hypothetical protein